MLAGNESRQVFSVGAAPYSVRDVVDAAFFRGELQGVWDGLLQSVAAEKQASEEERELDEAAVGAAAQTFRYDHDLITAEETERWLSDRGLTLSDFSDYFSRQYWSEFMSDVEPEPLAYTGANTEWRELLVAELMFSGELGRMATRLGWRLAAAAGGEAPGAEGVRAQVEIFRGRIAPLTAEQWSASSGRDEEWIEQMARLEANFHHTSEQILTPQARQRELGTLRLELTKVELEVIEFDALDVAREAWFCVRDDGMAMEEVATEGRYPFHREEMLLEDIAPEIQQRFLSVLPGELLEPMELGGGYRLCRMIGKSEPNPDDASVRQRVEQRLLDRHFADLLSRHVHWDLALS